MLNGAVAKKREISCGSGPVHSKPEELKNGTVFN